MHPQTIFYIKNALQLIEKNSLDEALLSLNRGMRIEPKNPHILRLHGVVAALKKEYKSALSYFNKALSVAPRYGVAYSNRANVLVEFRKYSEALLDFDRALAIDPADAEVYNNKGNLLFKLKKFEDAIKNYEFAIELQPTYAEAYSNRGNALKELGNYDGALMAHDCAISVNPIYAPAHHNKGVVLDLMGRNEEALISYKNAILINPKFIEALLNCGNLLERLRRYDQALDVYQRILEVDPQSSDAQWNRALVLLTQGKFSEGWSAYEHRWKNSNQVQEEFEEIPKLLNLENLEGLKILIWSEQGLGDTLQFFRYLKILRKFKCDITFRCQPELKKLLEFNNSEFEVVLEVNNLDSFDYQLPLLSLPRLFNTEEHSIPQDFPYVFADPQKIDHWNFVLGRKNKPRVGVVWSGGFRPDRPETWGVNKRRNIPLNLFKAFSGMNVDFIGLQKGKLAVSELAQLEADGWDGPKIINFDSQLNDFSDTAALIECLDLVIAVDTSTAHLAGALGRPVWILNRFDTCWRWMEGRKDTPWYPSASIFNQSSPGGWEGVMRDVKESLCRFLEN